MREVWSEPRSLIRGPDVLHHVQEVIVSCELLTSLTFALSPSQSVPSTMVSENITGSRELRISSVQRKIPVKKVSISLNCSETFLAGRDSVHPEILVRAIKIKI